ncbi:MAG: thiolase family protein, partial [Pseudomonadota bacterium]|nr:thiolase family protein [Pseudomonadota bacterium]
MTHIVYAKRTPIAKFMGSLQSLTAPQIAQPLVSDALKQFNNHTVDEIIMGQVLTAGNKQSPARQAALLGGLPNSVCALTINRVCGSGLKSVMLADQALKNGDAQVIFAGGQECMSYAPHLLLNSRTGWKFGEGKLLDHMQLDGLTDAYENAPMGNYGELCAKKYGISRTDQDDYALRSYQLATQSWQTGHFSQEVVAVEVPQRRNTLTFTKDEEPFAVNLDKLRTLRPAFETDGTITAGNASSISDGAALLVLAHPDVDCPPLARIVAQASHAQEPAWFTTAPVAAINKVCAKAKLKLQDIGLFEINEAFATVPLAVSRELNLDMDKVNV